MPAIDPRRAFNFDTFKQKGHVYTNDIWKIIMPNIVHRIGLDNVAPKEVYSALATIKGLAGWWTESVSGESKVGGILQFRFGEDGPDFEVLELHKPTRVCWRCVAGPSEWIDTHVQFSISTLDDETVLVFRHCGWRDEVEFMHHYAVGLFFDRFKKVA